MNLFNYLCEVHNNIKALIRICKGDSLIGCNSFIDSSCLWSTFMIINSKESSLPILIHLWYKSSRVSRHKNHTRERIFHAHLKSKCNTTQFPSIKKIYIWCGLSGSSSMLRNEVEKYSKLSRQGRRASQKTQGYDKKGHGKWKNKKSLEI